MGVKSRSNIVKNWFKLILSSNDLDHSFVALLWFENIEII